MKDLRWVVVACEELVEPATFLAGSQRAAELSGLGPQHGGRVPLVGGPVSLCDFHVVWEFVRPFGIQHETSMEAAVARVRGHLPSSCESIDCRMARFDTTGKRPRIR